MIRKYSKTNPKTGVSERFVAVDVKLVALETSSKSNSNGKSFGFLRTECGKTGIAYKSTADTYGDIKLGETSVVIEAKASDIANGENNKWQLALPVATDVDPALIALAKEFLAE